MEHIHSVYDTDLHFIIDTKTRGIKNNSGKVSLIQNDHNSERFGFELPRYVDGHDMSVCDKVEIHYINVSHHNEKSEDVYLVDDMQVSPASNDMVIFSWLISANATKYAGTLNFLIRFVCLDGEKVAYAWHTGIFNDITVGEGMNNAAAVIETPPDILEAWKKEVLGDAEAAAARAETAAEKAEAAGGGGIKSIEKTSTEGLVDTYTITLADGRTSTFTVTNGKDGADGKDGEDGADGKDGEDGSTPDLSGYVTTAQFEAALGAYITDLDTLVGGGL